MIEAAPGAGLLVKQHDAIHDSAPGGVSNGIEQDCKDIDGHVA